MASNAAKKNLMFALLDDLLDTPAEERIDWKCLTDASFAQLDDLLKNGRDRLYPDAPKEPIRPSIPLEEYTGTFAHTTCGTFNLTLVEPDQRLPFLHKPKQNLQSDMLDGMSPYISSILSILMANFFLLTLGYLKRMVLNPRAEL